MAGKVHKPKPEMREYYEHHGHFKASYSEARRAGRRGPVRASQRISEAPAHTSVLSSTQFKRHSQRKAALPAWHSGREAKKLIWKSKRKAKAPFRKAKRLAMPKAA